MDSRFEPLIQALDATANAVLSLSPTETRGLNVVHGAWNIPAASLPGLAGLASALSEDIKAHGLDELSERHVAILADLAQRVDFIRANTVPQIWGGNGASAIPAFVLGLAEVRQIINPLIPTTEVLAEGIAVPSRLARRIKRLNDDVDRIVVDQEALKGRMKAINDAYETAQTLPEDLESLREAREEISRISNEAGTDARDASTSKKLSEDHLAEIKALREAAGKLVEQCEEAYRVTTSKGLAGAFELRAQGLTRSMQLWVAALVVALIIASWIGYHRVELLSASIAVVEPKWGAIWLNFALSLLSVGAPLWFAWVATKQIGQRFRLSEDYAYKASISKAYEGYRREAANLDPSFAARLFGSSLTRLEEPPMRLMEATAHGSPLHELMSLRARNLSGKPAEIGPGVSTKEDRSPAPLSE